ncbi:hypothetical protein C7I85_14115 [Mesorhizobium soli]|uniref:Uncharacterized protein n=1 Tax=Pseudaminobacter soli (ex Li et al. 2025) TaxID=1295366 RepID=A0A2P7SD83_9HYPH|nr:hypothetical protein C7I85_14115 [Mesorhizobium soli]
MKIVAFAAFLFVLAPGLSHAADWHRYGNARFQYWVDIPPGFSAISEADNGDGGVSRSSDGRAELRVWGSYLLEDDFKNEVKGRVDLDVSDGWTIAYRKQGATWASWSGLKGDRVFYERAVPICDGAAAYFRIEYDKEQAKTFDPIVSRLVKSLKSGTCR